MSVRDGAPWVSEAVASVLAQTASDLELIVIDDGSTDATPELIAAVRDPRLRVERQPSLGLTRCLNRAIALARAPLLARLDADDVAAAERLARQRSFLDSHPDVGLLGTGAREVDASGREVRTVRPPADDAAIRRALIRANPFVHSSVMMRRSVVEQVNGYDETLPVAQDYDLWMRMSRHTRLANLPAPLVVRRLVPGRISAERDAERLQTEARVRWRAVRSGAYPSWCAIFLLKPLGALCLPRPLRRFLRRQVVAARPSP
ncbi:MAG TPA: glycosyltransferase [Methylomirabilota bacterium]|jgi:glycosyltransferase involved in cell wall biosynthesis|nr:glycosyltransferase [Methylomirabilota bacterium]